MNWRPTLLKNREIKKMNQKQLRQELFLDRIYILIYIIGMWFPISALTLHLDEVKSNFDLLVTVVLVFAILLLFLVIFLAQSHKINVTLRNLKPS